MAKISGKGGSVRYGANLVAEQVEWEISGMSKAATRKDTAFGDTVAEYEAVDATEPGTIRFSGNYDPADTNGQQSLATICNAGTHITTLYLYANTSTFWRVSSGGFILVTRADAVTMPRNNFGKVTFEGQVSDAILEQVGSGS